MRDKGGKEGFEVGRFTTKVGLERGSQDRVWDPHPARGREVNSEVGNVGRTEPGQGKEGRFGRLSNGVAGERGGAILGGALVWQGGNQGSYSADRFRQLWDRGEG